MAHYTHILYMTQNVDLILHETFLCDKHVMKHKKWLVVYFAIIF
jgi:hypothetical protein